MTFTNRFWASLFAIVALSLVAPGASAQQTLLIQDTDPWGQPAWNDELDTAGVTYSQIGTGGIPGTNLALYDLIIVASFQDSAFNTALLARIADFEDFVSDGGVLIWSAGIDDTQLPYPDPPFGGVVVHDYDGSNDVVDPTHPLLDNVPDPVTGSWASHGDLTGLPVNANSLLTNSGTGETVLYTLNQGDGVMLGAGITWELGWFEGWPGGDILINAIAWAQTALACTGADADADGWTDCEGDCDDGDPAIHPSAVEICEDGIDQNCDGQMDETADADGDGYSNCDGDCDDFNPDAVPGHPEDCDGVDNDCDGALGAGEHDVDLDGQTECAGDCDDGNDVVGDGFPELCDGIDNDCDGVPGADEADGDGDTFMACEDCDDGDAEVYPGAPGEVCDDDVDTDCAGDLEETEVDNDGDGYSECGGDCDDSTVDVGPDAPEICDEGVDNDCDPATGENTDADADGASICDGDCDDFESAVYPDAEEVCDELDNNCNDMVDEGYDQDLDGYSACGGVDCDDNNAAVNPGADDIPYNGIDEDCDGEDMRDLDGDGWDGGEEGEALDCDDNNPDVYPGAPEECGDGIDGDCDGRDDGRDPDCGGAQSTGGCDCDLTGQPTSPAWAPLALGLLLVLRRRRG